MGVTSTSLSTGPAGSRCNGVYYHPEKRLIYLAHPRTASVATANTLKRVGFEKWGGDHHLRLWEHSAPRAAHLPDPRPNGSELVTKDNRRDWTVFTVVRNQWDTAASWVFRRFKTWTHPEFNLKNLRTALEYNYWVDVDLPIGECRFWGLHSDDADEILRYESLDTDINQLLVRFGLPTISIVRFNVSKHRRGRSYRELHSEETRRYVAEQFSEEIERFGYGF